MYKLLSITNNKLVSFNGYGLEYKIGEWTYPKFGKLFVFNGLYQAKQWCGYQNVIYKCEIIGEPEKPKFICNINMCSNNNIKEFWENGSYKVSQKSIPIGTYLLDAVKITEEV